MINCLIINADNDGVGYHRVLNSHLAICDPELNIDIRFINDHTLPLLDERFLSQYQIIFYNKAIPFQDGQKIIFDSIISKYNIKKIFDIDDYWKLDSTHINYKSWKDNKGTETTIQNIKDADCVTTTTELFANYIREYNKNVVVLPNTINFLEQEWVSNKKKSDKIRFLWGGGIAHSPDLRLLSESFKSFDKEFLEKAQLYLCGFDLRLSTEKGMVKKANENSNPWIFFESIFTNNHKYVMNNEYRQWLNTFEKPIDDKFANEFYQRIWTQPVLLYGEMYNNADVTLAPIKNNITYNYVKSQLKIIEAGAHKCPIIASNYGSYTIDDVEGKKDGKQKGFLIDESDKMGWYNKMKWFTKNPNAVIDFGENNYEYIKANYDVNVINKIRCELYKNIVRL